MNHKMIRATLVLLSTLTLALALFAHPTQAQAVSAPTAKGNAQALMSNGTLEFSFRFDATGVGTSATGSATFTLSDGTTVDMNVTCLDVFSSNMASISGPITRSENPAFPPGGIGFFGVSDTPDEISSFVAGPSTTTTDCTTLHLFGLFGIQKGNIQVSS